MGEWPPQASVSHQMLRLGGSEALFAIDAGAGMKTAKAAAAKEASAAPQANAAANQGLQDEDAYEDMGAAANRYGFLGLQIGAAFAQSFGVNREAEGKAVTNMG
ncbi:MAG: hypothetical protein HYV63_16960 [Candidatus Schekmanbacteria bacterium]|nr:hypothetical protein [Candidatus Schekmanbacteria bacterium]